eukprot:jgi/Ulvmu1/1956/UM012_0117.1
MSSQTLARDWSDKDYILTDTVSMGHILQKVTVDKNPRPIRKWATANDVFRQGDGRLYRWTESSQSQRKDLALAGEVTVIVHVDSLGDAGHNTKLVSDKWVAAMTTVLGAPAAVVRAGVKTWRAKGRAADTTKRGGTRGKRRTAGGVQRSPGCEPAEEAAQQGSQGGKPCAAAAVQGSTGSSGDKGT